MVLENAVLFSCRCCVYPFRINLQFKYYLITFWPMQAENISTSLLTRYMHKTWKIPRNVQVVSESHVCAPIDSVKFS